MDMKIVINCHEEVLDINNKFYVKVHFLVGKLILKLF